MGSAHKSEGERVRGKIGTLGAFETLLPLQTLLRARDNTVRCCPHGNGIDLGAPSHMKYSRQKLAGMSEAIEDGVFERRPGAPAPPPRPPLPPRANTSPPPPPRPH